MNKILISLFFLFCTGAASAQTCTVSERDTGYGWKQRVYDGNCTPNMGVPAPVNMQYGSSQRCPGGQEVVINGRPICRFDNVANPFGAGITSGTRVIDGQRMECHWKDRVASGVVGGIIGGFIGVLAGDNHRSAGIGAAVGAGTGATLLCDPTIVDDGERQAQGQQIVRTAPQGAAGQPVSQQVSGGQTTIGPGVCIVEGRNYPNLADDRAACLAKVKDLSVTAPKKCVFDNGEVVQSNDCAAEAEKRTTKVSPQVHRESVSTGNPVPESLDLWKWRGPKGCVVEHLTGEPKPDFCPELKELPKEGTESRSQWALRAEKMY